VVSPFVAPINGLNLDTNHSIVDYLKRPALLGSYNINTDVNPAALYVETDRPSTALFDLPRVAMTIAGRANKLANFRYFSATSKLKIMFNVSPYVEGLFFIGYAPMDDFKPDVYKLARRNLPSLTSCPGDLVDIQLMDSYEITVPWCDTRDCGMLNGSTTDFRNARLGIFPLYVKGPSVFNINIQVYHWFDDITLKGPTFYGPITIDATLQIAHEGKGPISEVATKVSSVSKVLSRIPIISDFAGPVSWISDLVGGVASSFGYSRPVIGSAVQPVNFIAARGFAQVKAEDVSTVLAMSNDNEISPSVKAFMTDTDEMSLEYVCNNPGVVETAAWRSSDPVGTSFFTTIVSTIPISTTVGPDKIYMPTNFEYVSMNTGYWRADIYYKIKFVKTPFHAGRLEVVFFPGEMGGVTGVDTSNCYKQIIDISQESELEICVPYMFTRPMLRSVLDSAPADESTFGLGTIAVTSISPLIHPDSVASEIGIVVSKYAKNCQFAGLVSRSKTLRLATNETPVSNEVNAHLQIAVGTVVNNPKFVAFGETNSDQINTTEYVCGEQLTSLRQLVKSHQFATHLPDEVTDLAQPCGASWDTYLGRFAPMYGFYRGGMSYKVFYVDSNINTITSQIHLDGERGIGARHITKTVLNPFHEIQVPFYGTCRREITCRNIVTFGIPTVTVVFSDEQTKPSELYLAAKDDFSFGMLLGPPSVFLATP
jgi:hypothetical protein